MKPSAFTALPGALPRAVRSRTGRVWLALFAVAAVAAVVGVWLATGRGGPAHAATGITHCDLPSQPASAPHPGMVWVPGGSFEFGDDVYPEELPIRRTSVAGFWMDRTEVTNRQFSAFVKATGYVTEAEREVDAARHPGVSGDLGQPGAVVFVMADQVQPNGTQTPWWRYMPGANWRHPGGPATSVEGRDDFPVVAVTYADAMAYARWKGGALPSEAQWEWAARAGQEQARLDHAQPSQANTWQGLFPVVNSGDDGFVGLAPAGCYPPNALGLFDMIGNVWELTSDAWKPSHDDSPRLRTGPVGQRVIKGGSYLCAPNYCARYRSGSRQPQDDDLGASHLGFRIVLAAPGP